MNYYRIAQYDKTHRTSYLRQIEMSLPEDTALQVQFFSDLRLYSLNEAILYLKESRVKPDIINKLREIEHDLRKRLNEKLG